MLLTTDFSLTLYGSMPSTKMSTLFRIPDAGTLREDLVVYSNSTSTMSPGVICPEVTRVSVACEPEPQV